MLGGDKGGVLTTQCMKLTYTRSLFPGIRPAGHNEISFLMFDSSNSLAQGDQDMANFPMVEIHDCFYLESSGFHKLM